MAFTTGSGTFTDLQNAIIAHALADGWTEANGLGTGFPLTIGNTFVDLQTYTETETDFTIGSTRGTFTATNGALGLGIDSASAAADAALGSDASARIPNATFAITNYFIFSDPASGSNYIHVCFEFTNGPDPRVFQHFSFGEVNKQGLTHGGISYVSSMYRRGYAASQGSGSSSGNWNSLNRSSWPFAGAVGEADDGSSDTSYIIHSPTPVDSAAGYPAMNTLIKRGAQMWDSTRMGGDFENTMSASSVGYKPGWSGMHITQNPPFTGAISLQILPCILVNSTGSSGSITWCGVFPDVRQGNMTNYSAGDEVSFGSDTWQIFPWTKQTANTLLNDQNIVTSGQACLAYRKVV